jgi:hypothetical protein
MNQLERDGYGEGRLLVFGGPATESDRKASRYRGLREQLHATLVDNLRCGKLVAQGYDARASVDAPPVTISSGRWRVLTPNFEDSSASAPGITISGILVQEAKVATTPPLEPAKAAVAPATIRLRIKRSQELAFVDGKEFLIPEVPFRLLCLLAGQAGKFVSRHEIEDSVWGDNDTETFRPGREAVGDLRKALARGGMGRDELRQFIQQRTGHGYRLQLTAEEVVIEA